MILTKEKIIEEVAVGRIAISPFNIDQVRENSYDVRLMDRLAIYQSHSLDLMRQEPVDEFLLPQEGLVIWPGKIYLGSTIEKIGSDYYVPDIGGRSTIARYGISIHTTAGWGETGFKSRWTLEITCTQPVRIYAGIRIAQVRFANAFGPITLYKGVYSEQDGPTPPMSHVF